ncbi:MAG: heparinase II/III family protein [Candidatus Andeanibacterium colombiense]|uniref:Heparinase II/III family protein n=1 Tax=Candidatus Andeanibacterium colombiense TaxID=3121345 RepID=A0AAJ5X5Z0_9SPHN|nr:MAG: heparinase II/III family protein [Sphingomonadaceae bacterium]
MDGIGTGSRLALDDGLANVLPASLAIPLDARAEPLASGGEEPPTELIEPGKAIALADFQPPALSAGERLIRIAYRLGVPGQTLAAPFRKPARLRLLATVESPLAGDRVAGVALRAGHFLIHGVKAPIAQMDFGPNARLTPPFERVLHGFEWLRDLAACAPREQCIPTAERVVALWLDANPAPGKGAAWHVGHAGHRLLNWLIHAPLILSSPDKALRARALAGMAATARWLDRAVGRAEDGMAETAGWCAIVAAGLLLPEGKPRRLYGEAGLIKVLGELIGDDGGVLSRSPLLQMEAIGLLAELSACYRAVRLDPPEALQGVLELLVPPLLGLTHGDGSLGCWQGAGAVGADAVAELVEASGVRARPLRHARQWGYQRATGGKAVLQLDAAPPPLARHTRSGCASTLAFEFSDRGQRIVVNCGGAAFAGGQVPVRIESGLRASAAHSTLVLDDVNSTAVLINGKLGTGVSEVELDRRTLSGEKGGNGTRLEASHDGYAQRYGLVHRRILILRDDGSELRGEDLLVPTGRKGKRGKVPFAIRFHIGPGVELGLGESGTGAGLALPDGSYWQFVAAAAEDCQLLVEESLWVDGGGKPHPIQQLVIQGMVSRGGGTFSWLLKRMG